MGMSALIIAGSADLFAGLLLNQMTDYLYLIPGMMILIYAAIGMRGNIFGAMGSRIGTAMNMGTFEMSFRKGTALRANVDGTITLTLLMSVLMGFAAWAIAILFFNGTQSVWDFVFISTLGGFLAGIIVMMVNILIAWEGNRREWDVDNITAPLIAAVGDIVTMPMIFFATWIYLRVGTGAAGEELIAYLSLAMIAVTLALTAWVIHQRGGRRDYIGEARRITLQSFPVLFGCLFFEIGAGIVIQGEQTSLVTYGVLMIMLPAFLNEGNALSGMLTSRLSSKIHLGTIRPTGIPARPALEDFVVMYICALVTFTYIGLISYGAAFLTAEANTGFLTTMIIIIVAGLLTTTALNLLSYYVAIITTRFGLDPDDHSIPITSSVMDLVGSLILVAVIAVFI
ncbi:MAG: magnesium transporter [Candidatus Methanomethylophilus sp.]|nr:magnesium transporter [Methanomethylophilus sp.]